MFPLMGKVKALSTGLGYEAAQAPMVQETDNWRMLPWEQYQRNVRRLQQRIYQATKQKAWRTVHQLQRLLLRSWSARCVAVRQVTQDNRGKRTAGIDGIANLRPTERLYLAESLKDLTRTASGIRRIYIPKADGGQRGLGIPTMQDRAAQALTKLALEPEWEAQFEPNSYGFRPGRSAHDAIEAIFNHIAKKPKYVLDADIEKCFDKISHEKLLAKLNTIPIIANLVQGWLKAGIFDKGNWHKPETGVPQGGVISPLLMNVAMHGFETAIGADLPLLQRGVVIRYADDFVILHADLRILLTLKAQAENWLAEIGLNMKDSKTHITHTLHKHEGNIGFDFLGFHIRQYPVGKYRTKTYKSTAGHKTLIKPSRKAVQRHLDKLKEAIQHHRAAPQAALIQHLNPVIRGWRRYYRTVVSKEVFSRVDTLLYHKLKRWARFRHSNKTNGWCKRRYWRVIQGRKRFATEQNSLATHDEEPITRHVKVRHDKSPFDGDWAYWTKRLGRDPMIPQRVAGLMRQQDGRCGHCNLSFTSQEVFEVHHVDGNHMNNKWGNLQLLHGRCHDRVHATAKRALMTTAA